MEFGVRQRVLEECGRNVLFGGRGDGWHHQRLPVGPIWTANHAFLVGIVADHFR